MPGIHTTVKRASVSGGRFVTFANDCAARVPITVPKKIRLRTAQTVYTRRALRDSIQLRVIGRISIARQITTPTTLAGDEVAALRMAAVGKAPSAIRRSQL